MLDAVLAAFLDNVTEREFDAPFMALLRGHGFSDVHLLHGSYEFGRDFIAKRSADGMLEQWAFQSKSGDISGSDWDRGFAQVDRLCHFPISHPSFDTTLPLKSALVLTGRLTGAAGPYAHEYSERLSREGRHFQVWDRERLIELARGLATIGLGESADGPLLTILGRVDGRDANDADIDRFSRRWFDVEADLWRITLEASIIAARLEGTNRSDLSCLVGLCLVRAAALRNHGRTPADANCVLTSDLGARLFGVYAKRLWDRRDIGHTLDAPTMLRELRDPAALITHAARCVRLAELVGLLGLMAPESAPVPKEEVAHWLAQFLRAQKAAAYLLSDRWAVSLIPPILLLHSAGFTAEIREHLLAVRNWICDRFQHGRGLADSFATPEVEVDYVLAGVVPPHGVRPRSESCAAAILLELTAFTGLSGTYRLVRADFAAVGALPTVLVTEDTAGQHDPGTTEASRCPNVPYSTELGGEWTSIAAHLPPSASPRYLENLGRPWDHLASSAASRDRYFPCCWLPLTSHLIAPEAVPDASVPRRRRRQPRRSGPDVEPPADAPTSH